MDTYLFSLVVILVGGILPLFTYKKFTVMKAACVIITAIGSFTGLYAALSFLIHPVENAVISWPWLHHFEIALQMDAMAAFFLIPIFFICPLATLYSFHYMHHEKQSGKTAISYFFSAVLFVSMALLTTANNMLTFALAWEIMSLSSFFLVVFDFRNKETRKAGYLYFIFAQAGALFLFAAFAVIYSQTGTLSFDSISAMPENMKLIAFVLAFMGLGSKAGVFPLHIWLPHAHPAAPSPVSAVMSGVMIKMGIFGIIRFYMLLAPAGEIYGQIILVAGMISGILGVVYALGVHDIKRLLAYSSVENIGIILLGLGLGMLGVATGNSTMAAFGFAGGLLHVFNHSIFKSLLFMGAGSVIHKAGTGKINELGGLMKTMPVTGKTFLVGAVSISGLPPFNGFVSEFLIYYGAFYGLAHGSSFLLPMLTIISLAVIGGLAASCFTKLVGVAFLGEPRTENAAKASECGIAMRISMVVLALSCIVVGVFPEPFVHIVFRVVSGLPIAATVSPTVFIDLVRNISLVAVLFLGILGITMLLRKGLYSGKPMAKGPTWGCGFTQPTVRMQYTGTSYAMSIVGFFRPFIHSENVYSGIQKIFPGKTTYKTKVSDRAESAILETVVKPVFWVLDKLRWIQHGEIQLYIAYIVLAIVILLLAQ
ncbi:MAG: hydrogenase [Desulfatibacillum sp.]|nr:hydrogenase [Desulfatibacillum sp.]